MNIKFISRSVFILLLLPLLFYTPVIRAQQVTAVHVIRVNHIVSNANAWKKFTKKSESDYNKFRERARKFQTELEGENKKLLEQQNVLARDALVTKRNALLAKQKKYETQLNKEKTNIDKRNARAQNEMRGVIISVTTDIAKERKIPIVLNSDASGAVVIVNNQLDLTDEVLKRVNKKLKTLKTK